MLFLLGLLLPVCFVVGTTGASIPTQWALLSIVLPPLIWRQRAFPAQWITWLMAAFFGFAAVSSFWSPQRDFSYFGLWTVGIWWLALQFGLGQKPIMFDDDGVADFDGDAPLWAGLAFGMAVNSAVAIAQWWFHASPVPVLTDVGSCPLDPTTCWSVPGLLYNPTLLSAVAGLVILGCVECKLWWHIPMILPGLLLAQSQEHHTRGGFAVLAVGLLSKIHWAAAPIALALVASAALIAKIPSDVYRLEIWGITYHVLTFWGHGVGSYASFFFINHNELSHPEFAHNDFLQLWFEFGVAALIPISLLVAGARSPVGIGALALACFYFPLYTPLTAFLTFFVVGRNLRDFSLAKLHSNLRGPALHRGDADPAHYGLHQSIEDFPLQLDAAGDRKEGMRS